MHMLLLQQVDCGSLSSAEESLRACTQMCAEGKEFAQFFSRWTVHVPFLSAAGKSWSLMEREKSTLDAREWTCQWRGSGRCTSRPSGVDMCGIQEVRDLVFALKVKCSLSRW